MIQRSLESGPLLGTAMFPWSLLPFPGSSEDSQTAAYLGMPILTQVPEVPGRPPSKHCFPRSRKMTELHDLGQTVKGEIWYRG